MVSWHACFIQALFARISPCTHLHSVFFHSTWGFFLLLVVSLCCDRLDNDGVIASLLAGGLAGITAWATAIPFDVIKSLMQVIVIQY